MIELNDSFESLLRRFVNGDLRASKYLRSHQHLMDQFFESGEPLIHVEPIGVLHILEQLLFDPHLRASVLGWVRQWRSHLGYVFDVDGDFEEMLLALDRLDDLDSEDDCPSPMEIRELHGNLESALRLRDG